MKLEAHCAICGRVTIGEVSEADISDAVSRTGGHPVVECRGCGGKAQVMRAFTCRENRDR